MKHPTIKIALLTPTYNRSGDWGSALGALAYASQKYRVAPIQKGHSALCQNFNMLLNVALNSEEAFTHVAMLHTDVSPEPCWIDKLMAIMDNLAADFVSAVIPIKTDEGLTSTGIGDHDDPWQPIKRFTMKEVYELPETFTASDAGYGGYPLIINTGCWIADLRMPLWSETDANGVARFAFEQIYRRRKLPNGKWIAEFEPEDWRLGKALHKAGARYYATRAVRLQHIGEKAFNNFEIWGLDTDPQAREPQGCKQ